MFWNCICFCLSLMNGASPPAVLHKEVYCVVFTGIVCARRTLFSAVRREREKCKQPMLLLLLCMKWQQRGGKKKIKSWRLSIKTFGGRLLSLLPIREKISFNFLENFVWIFVHIERSNNNNKRGGRRRKNSRETRVILQCHTNVTVQLKKKSLTSWRSLDIFVLSPWHIFGIFVCFHLKLFSLVFFNSLGSHASLLSFDCFVVSVHLRLLRPLGHLAHLPSEMLLAPAGTCRKKRRSQEGFLSEMEFFVLSIVSWE